MVATWDYASDARLPGGFGADPSKLWPADEHRPINPPTTYE